MDPVRCFKFLTELCFIASYSVVVYILGSSFECREEINDGPDCMSIIIYNNRLNLFIFSFCAMSIACVWFASVSGLSWQKPPSFDEEPQRTSLNRPLVYTENP